MKTLLYPIFALFFVIFFACGNAASSAEVSEDHPQQYTFRKPEPPAVLSTPEQKIEYMVDHYWDHFDFTDTAYIHLPEITEQAFSDYLLFLSVSPTEKADQSIRAMLSKAQQDTLMFEYITDLYEKYLYDPNSPYRDEELYIPVLRYIIASPDIDPVYKIRPESQLESALKNRPGTRAADLRYKTATGATGNLYGIKADFILLYFNNPGCEACAESRAHILQSPVFTRAIETGLVKVVAIYPDQDLGEWHKELPVIPAEWINGYDHNLDIRRRQTYDIRAIPSFYLLDKDKTVLLKDAPLNEIEQLIVKAF